MSSWLDLRRTTNHYCSILIVISLLPGHCNLNNYYNYSNWLFLPVLLHSEVVHSSHKCFISLSITRCHFLSDNTLIYTPQAQKECLSGWFLGSEPCVARVTSSSYHGSSSHSWEPSQVGCWLRDGPISALESRILWDVWHTQQVGLIYIQTPGSETL